MVALLLNQKTKTYLLGSIWCKRDEIEIKPNQKFVQDGWGYDDDKFLSSVLVVPVEVENEVIGYQACRFKVMWLFTRGDKWG